MAFLAQLLHFRLLLHFRQAKKPEANWPGRVGKGDRVPNCGCPRRNFNAVFMRSFWVFLFSYFPVWPFSNFTILFYFIWLLWFFCFVASFAAPAGNTHPFTPHHIPRRMSQVLLQPWRYSLPPCLYLSGSIPVAACNILSHSLLANKLVTWDLLIFKFEKIPSSPSTHCALPLALACANFSIKPFSMLLTAGQCW